VGAAKNIELKPIPSRVAIDFVKKHHYSGKVAANSQLHIGVFYAGLLGGVMQFGPPIDRSKLIGLVRGSKTFNFLELNRMAFSDLLPRNSESRAISVACKLIAKNAPQVKWVVSFADATQCGDGTIYRASGFLLTSIKESKNLASIPGLGVIHKLQLEANPNSPRKELGGRSYYDFTGGRYNWGEYIKHTKGRILPGFQIRYIKFIDPTWRDRLTVPVLPFSALDEAGARMYKGEKPQAQEV